jgi:hypothetical protein
MRFTEFISEAGSPAQQAAIAVAMKKAGKKPKDVAESSPNADVKKQISKFEELALAANRAGDDAKCKQYQQKVQSLKQKMSQGVAEGSDESYMIIRTDAEGKRDVFAGNFDTYERAQKELDGLLTHPLHTKYKQKFEIKRKSQQGVAEGSEMLSLDDKIKIYSKHKSQAQQAENRGDYTTADKHKKQASRIYSNIVNLHFGDDSKDAQNAANEYIRKSQGVAEGSLNELSSGLLQRAAQAATDKRNQAMDPELHNALGGGYMNPLATHYDNVSQKINNRAGQVRKKETIQKIASKIASPAVMRKMGMSEQGVAEEWSKKYKSSINCSHPKGFSQKAHCAGKKKHNESIMMEMVCEDCGMCQTHGDHENLDEACWKGYHKEGNKKMFGKTYPNCVKNTNEEQLDEKCWDTHKQVGMKNKGGRMVPNCVPKESAESTDQVLENLHKWFKEKWVRFGPDGKIRGDCARGSESEGKPKCLPQSKAHSLGKKGRASAASRKRREDPNANRSGKAINVSTKGKGK